KQTALLQNYPNPFNPETWIPYRLATTVKVEISIYDMGGHRIRTLQIGTQPEGEYIARSKAAYWDGRNDTGEPVSSGIYFYHLKAGAYHATRRMIILK
ncbi:T9SS type A sorting domain-containing protein, partial [Candidatus Poribacteria bacterium]|nr:T9SS type A sorting domain-containing protein [Candidatus Poribacteria bacterium]